MLRRLVLHAAGLQQLDADHVIVAIPFSVLRHCEMDASVSPDEKMAISQMRYESKNQVLDRAGHQRQCRC
jgi:monoamine oxidase